MLIHAPANTHTRTPPPQARADHGVGHGRQANHAVWCTRPVLIHAPANTHARTRTIPRRVLTMEWVTGVKLTTLCSAHAPC